MRTVSLDHSTFGKLVATWEREGRMIVVRYGHHEKRAQASDNDKVNEVLALDILRGIVAQELKD
ncbi:hypothetical protein A6U91_02595 [Agrobacterium tumefaciens]|uniref:Uncharacterized protein n=1 Tax=Agrobacterium tumefaciens TaxID=358 RepID=A0AB36EU21_AGRTU|nr:hypothetical protein A6U91_02595 [Agrobacterium tumefaciens]